MTKLIALLLILAMAIQVIKPLRRESDASPVRIVTPSAISVTAMVIVA